MGGLGQVVLRNRFPEADSLQIIEEKDGFRDWIVLGKTVLLFGKNKILI